MLQFKPRSFHLFISEPGVPGSRLDYDRNSAETRTEPSACDYRSCSVVHVVRSDDCLAFWRYAYLSQANAVEQQEEFESSKSTRTWARAAVSFATMLVGL